MDPWGFPGHSIAVPGCLKGFLGMSGEAFQRDSERFHVVPWDSRGVLKVFQGVSGEFQ